MKKLIFIVSFVFLALFFTHSFNSDHIQLYAQKKQVLNNFYDSLMIASVGYISSHFTEANSIISIDKQVFKLRQNSEYRYLFSVEMNNGNKKCIAVVYNGNKEENNFIVASCSDLCTTNCNIIEDGDYLECDCSGSSITVTFSQDIFSEYMTKGEQHIAYVKSVAPLVIE